MGSICLIVASLAGCALPTSEPVPQRFISIGSDLSARTGEGVAVLRAWLLEVAGWPPSSEGVFLARERHLVALREARGRLESAAGENAQVFELFAEDLRLAQHSLGSITGEVTPDELLGQIFSRFCIGK